MTKRLFSMFLCLAAIVLGLASCTKDEETMTGNISGFVSDYANPNRAVAGASVTLNTKGITKTTGSDGRFEFGGIEPGTYTVAVAADGYQTNTKQVTVYAGQNATCDFQLSKASAMVEINPQTLAFGTATDQLTFTIKNKSSQSMPYTITGYPAYLSVSPASATVASMATQTVTVRVNRGAITKDEATSLIVNVGNDSYPVAVSVGHNSLSSKLSISESSLNFGKTYNELQFTLKNTGTSGDLNWTIDQPTQGCLSVSPRMGTLAMGKEAKVTVTLDRSKLTADFQSFITINAVGGSASIAVTALKGNGPDGEDDPSNPNADVKNGLYTYFTFENKLEDKTSTKLNANGNGISYVESFNGTKALCISAKAGSLFSIPEGLVDQPKMSVSFWVKDLYDGHVFHVVRASKNTPAFTLAQVDGRLKFVVTNYHNTYAYKDCASFIHSDLSNGWHMIALTSDFNSTTYATVTTKLYVDGVYTDMITEDDNPFSESESGDGKNYKTGIKFIMGGSLDRPDLPATSLTIDNFRVYKSRVLSDDEVRQIYNYEKK